MPSFQHALAQASLWPAEKGRACCRGMAGDSESACMQGALGFWFSAFFGYFGAEYLRWGTSFSTFWGARLSSPATAYPVGAL